MDQTNEEALRQELTYLREKLQDQPVMVPMEYEEKQKELEEENKRLQAMIEGKLMNLSGQVLLIESVELFNSNPNAWSQLSKKFNCGIVMVPNNGLQHLKIATDDQLQEAGLKKVKTLQPYPHLDELMHYLQAQLDLAKNLNQPEYTNLDKGGMTQVYETMEIMKLISEFRLEEKDVPPKEGQ